MYAKHCLVLCVLLAVVNAVVSQQEEQVRHRFSVYLLFKALPYRYNIAYNLLITGCIL